MTRRPPTLCLGDSSRKTRSSRADAVQRFDKVPAQLGLLFRASGVLPRPRVEARQVVLFDFQLMFSFYRHENLVARLEVGKLMERVKLWLQYKEASQISLAVIIPKRMREKENTIDVRLYNGETISPPLKRGELLKKIASCFASNLLIGENIIFFDPDYPIPLGKFEVPDTNVMLVTVDAVLIEYAVRHGYQCNVPELPGSLDRREVMWGLEVARGAEGIVVFVDLDDALLDVDSTLRKRRPIFFPDTMNLLQALGKIAFQRGVVFRVYILTARREANDSLSMHYLSVDSVTAALIEQGIKINETLFTGGFAPKVNLLHAMLKGIPNYQDHAVFFIDDDPRNLAGVRSRVVSEPDLARVRLLQVSAPRNYIKKAAAALVDQLLNRGPYNSRKSSCSTQASSPEGSADPSLFSRSRALSDASTTASDVVGDASEKKHDVGLVYP